MKVFNHSIYQVLRVNNVIGISSKNCGHYFSLDLCAQFFFSFFLFSLEKECLKHTMQPIFQLFISVSTELVMK